MKTIIIGGGKGCRALLDLTQGSFMTELMLDIQCVVDPRLDASGITYARELGIPTSTDMQKALSHGEIDLIIELTGQDHVLEEIHKLMPTGAKIIDHTFAHVFWDLVNARNERERRLREMTRLEQRVEQEKFFLQNMLDNLPELLVVLDTNRRVLRINRPLSEFVGIKPEDARGKTCIELLNDTPLAKNCRDTSAVMDRVFETRQPISMIWQTPPPDEMYWEVTRTPILTSEGELRAVLGVWHRITEEVLLRRELESGELRFRSFIDSAHDWISMKDLDGRYIIVNPVCAAAFNHTPEEFVGRQVEELLPPDVARITKLHDQEVIRTNRHHTYNEIVPIDGRDHHFQAVRFPLHDYRGETIGVCTIMRDLTTEHELNSQLIQASKLAAVGQLAAGVAHEINNPLTGILAYAEEMLDELEEENEHRDDMQVIIREALRCRDIVRNLLNFARQEAPRLDDVNPIEVVDAVLSLVKKLPQFRNIAITTRLDEQTPVIRCDQHQIQQVLLNFMLNAAEAMEQSGAITISTEYERRTDRCIISVQDSGPGIPENLIDKIFEPFFSTKGTNGLGLAVSWGIVERHGGTIEVDTPEEGGAAFRIVLPVSGR